MDDVTSSPGMSSPGVSPDTANTSDGGGEDVDALYDSIMNPKADNGFLADDAKAPVETKPAALEPEVAPPEPEHEIDYKGSKIKAPLSKILKWAQQGYDYPQRMADLNRREESSNKLAETYRPIDEWVSANPDKWEKLQRAIELEQAGLGDVDPNNPLVQTVHELKAELATIKQERIQKVAAEQDKSLDADIQSIREQFKDLDWASADDNGRDREAQVIDHAINNGIKSFKAAFKDLFFDELLTHKEVKTREALAAAKQKQMKQGILPSQTAKAPGITRTTNTNKSYDQLAQEALDEVQAGRHG